MENENQELRAVWKIIPLVLLIGLVLFGIYYFSNDILNIIQPSRNESESTDGIEESAQNVDLSYSAWIPSWGTDSGFDSFKQNREKFDSISPVWYELGEEGSIISNKPEKYNDIELVAIENDIKIIPAIAMFDHELFSDVLNDVESFDRQIENILAEVIENDYDGIDLDYESTQLDDKELYFQFLEDLSEKLHERNKVLVVTVIPKWGDDINYPSLPETRKVQDWSRISEYADEIRIMAYDYTFSKSTSPGPIAPLGWVEKVLDYAVEKVPSEKLVLGVHLYSYEWWEEIENPELSIEQPESLGLVYDAFINPFSDSQTARSYTYSTVQKILQNYPGKQDEYEGEQIYNYSKVNDDTGIFENRTLVFIDPDGIKAREELAKQYGLKGLVFWRLGGDGDLLLN